MVRVGPPGSMNKNMKFHDNPPITLVEVLCAGGLGAGVID